MNVVRKLRANARLIWAITAKDLVDAIKNKNALANMASTLFIMVLYAALPYLRAEAPLAIVYDVGDSTLVRKLEESEAARLYGADSSARMRAIVADMDEAALGLVLPRGLDDQIDAGEDVALEGYFAYWVTDEKADETRLAIESAIAAVTGAQVRIDTEGNVVQATLESTGTAVLMSLTVSIVVTMLGVTILPHLMIEERQTKTIDLLLVSPATIGQVVLGKALTGIFYCLVPVAALFIFYSTTIVHWGLAVLAVLLGALFTVGTGLLLGSVLKVKQQLVLWGFVLMMVLMLPLMLVVVSELLPDGLVTVLRWVPTTALARAVTVCAVESATISDVGRELALLTASAAAVLGAVVIVVRRSDR
jgi:ABC-2 type transport system permease protein